MVIFAIKDRWTLSGICVKGRKKYDELINFEITGLNLKWYFSTSVAAKCVI
jgi:hypothetical protein